MDMKTFEHNLLSYGGDLSRWEGGDIKAVLAFVEENVQAQTLLAQAVQVEEKMQAYKIPEFDEQACVRAIMDKIHQSHRKPSRSFLPAGPAIKSLSGWAGRAYAGAGAALVLGLFILMGGANIFPGIGQNQSYEVAQIDSEIDDVLASVIALEQETQNSEEILALFEIADAQDDMKSYDIDAAIDDLLAEQQDTDAPAEDIWQKFMM